MVDTTAPPADLYTVDAATYEQALGWDLEHVDAAEVAVDRRGFSPDVAEVYSESYILNDVFIFGPEQENAPLLHDEYSFIDDLLDDIYGNEEIVQYAESEEPLMLDIEVTTEDDGFYGRALLEDTDVKEAIDHAQEVRDTLRDVTEAEIMVEDRIRELYAEAREVYERFGGLRDIEFSEEMGRVEVDAFRFDWSWADGEGTGFAFHTADALVYDGGRPDVDRGFPILNVRQQEYTLPDGVGTVLGKLHDMGHVEINKDGILDRRDAVAAEAFTEIAAELEDVEHVLLAGGTFPSVSIESLDLPYTAGEEVTGLRELVEEYRSTYGVAPSEEENPAEDLPPRQHELLKDVQTHETAIEAVQAEYDCADVEIGKVAFYDAMDRYEEAIPEEYHILRYLGRDQDFTIDTAADAVKLDYVTVPTREVEEDDEVREEVEHPIVADYLDHLRGKNPAFFQPDDVEDDTTNKTEQEEPEQDDDGPVRIGNEYRTSDSSANIDFQKVLQKYTGEGFDRELQRYLEEKLFGD